MLLSKQVVNLKLSQKLKELGCKQDSLYSYIFTEKMNCDTKDGDWCDWKLKETIKNPTDTCGEQISAYTVAELGEMLPDQIDNGVMQDPDFIQFERRNTVEGDGYAIYIETMDCLKKHIEKSDTEANCRAKMLIYLIENKLIKVS